MLLFVGLGNPTPDSENNRHNVGFKIIDAINKDISPETLCAYIGACPKQVRRKLPS